MNTITTLTNMKLRLRRRSTGLATLLAACIPAALAVGCSGAGDAVDQGDEAVTRPLVFQIAYPEGKLAVSITGAKETRTELGSIVRANVALSGLKNEQLTFQIADKPIAGRHDVRALTMTIATADGATSHTSSVDDTDFRATYRRGARTNTASYSGVGIVDVFASAACGRTVAQRDAELGHGAGERPPPGTERPVKSWTIDAGAAVGTTTLGADYPYQRIALGVARALANAGVSHVVPTLVERATACSLPLIAAIPILAGLNEVAALGAAAAQDGGAEGGEGGAGFGSSTHKVRPTGDPKKCTVDDHKSSVLNDVRADVLGVTAVLTAGESSLSVKREPGARLDAQNTASAFSPAPGGDCPEVFGKKSLKVLASAHGSTDIECTGGLCCADNTEDYVTAVHAELKYSGVGPTVDVQKLKGVGVWEAQVTLDGELYVCVPYPGSGATPWGAGNMTATSHLE